MKLIILLLGCTLQSWLIQARVFQIQIPQSVRNPTLSTNVEVSPGSSGPMGVPSNTNFSVNIGSNNFVSQTDTTSNFTVVRGLDCGSTVQMYPGNSAQVFSTNFGVAHYYNNEACTWRFEANQCTLSADCPCVDLPTSWECLGDYLKIRTDYVLQNQRFCGGNKPGQPIYSDTDFLSVRFRSDGKTTAAGFTCFIRCEGPGMNMSLLSNVKCPTSVTSQQG